MGSGAAKGKGSKGKGKGKGSWVFVPVQKPTFSKGGKKAGKKRGKGHGEGKKGKKPKTPFAELSDERKEKSAPGPRQLIQSKGVKLEMSPRTSARYCSAARSKARRSEAKT